MITVLAFAGVVAGGETACLASVYDDNGRIASVQHGEGDDARVTLFHYDAHGHLAEAIDPLQRTHHYEHDVVGRVRAQTRPDGARIAFD